MQQISGLFRRRALLAALIAFGTGTIIIAWVVIGAFTQAAPPATAAVELPFEELPAEDVGLEMLPAEGEPDGQPQPQDRSEPDSVVVYVSGAVRAPDVYRLPADARVKDLIVAAGGFSIDADPEAINLAARISDAQQIKVPRRGEQAAAVQAELEAAAADDGDLINLNTASATELDQLPGIGMALAERIIDYRSTNGPFESIDDLGNVKGIGAALLEQIAPLLTVGG